MNSLKVFPFYLLLIMTFGLAGFEKLVSFSTPSWFVSQFQGSLLDVFPGSLGASFAIIALLELATFLVLLIGMIRKNENLLGVGIILAQMTFVALGFGQRLTQKHDSAALLFFYAVLTFVGGHIALKKRAD